MNDALRRRIIWHFIQHAKTPPPSPNTLTISGTSGSTNGIFIIDSIATATSFSTTIPVPGQLPQLYSAGKSPGIRSVDPRELAKRRQKAKASRAARKKNRR